MRLVLMIVALTLALHAAEPGDVVRIPAGEFTMGRTKSTPDDKTQMRPKVVLDDRPVRKVQVSAFSMDAFEVTQEQYAKFAAATKRAVPYHWAAGKVPPDHAAIPVFNVSWQDVNDYCKWQNKRLPTEAEWEKAARGGLDGMDYPLGNKLDDKAARYSSPNGPSQVGNFLRTHMAFSIWQEMLLSGVAIGLIASTMQRTETWIRKVRQQGYIKLSEAELVRRS